MKVLSLFDGMACGMIAMQNAGITVDRYVAYEIDKYAIQTATHNFPMIEECGDVFNADFTQYEGRPTKVISAADGKTYTVYEVKDGQITIKGKQYPIKLIDGYYIIRKPTVRECMRLQTVPEWYEFPVSDSQAYKMLGNGWTCDVITHLINATMVAQTKWLDELLGGGE